MMKKYIPILLLGLISFTGISQSVPGYLGKRMSVSYYGYTFPSLMNPTGKSIEFSDVEESMPKQFDFSLNYQHHVMFEYVLTKEYSIVVDFNYTHTYFDALSGNYSIDSAEYYSFSDHPSLSALGFALGFRDYSKHFAPLGAYVEYRLGYTHLNVGDFKYLKYGEEKVINGGTTSGLLFGLGFGTKRVIADKWQIDFGVELAGFSKGWGNVKSLLRNERNSYISFDYYSGQSDSDKEEALLKRAEGRFALHSMINFRLGIGLLL